MRLTIRIAFLFQVFLAIGVLIDSANLQAKAFIQPPSAQAPNAQAGNRAPQQQPSSELTAEQRQQLTQRLAKEMDDLIPGEYADQSKQKQKLNEAANFFIDLDEKNLRSSLSELASMDPNVPPQELLLAGLAYATNNLTRGKAILEQSAVQHREHPGFPLAFARLAILQARYFDAAALAEKTQSLNRSSRLSAEAKSFYELEVLDVLTTVELNRNELPRAQQYVQKWEQIAPNNDKMLLSAAEINFLQNKADKAVSYLNRRSKKVADELPTEGIIAKWYLANGDTDQYNQWIRQAFEKHKSNGFIQIEYAAWLLRQEDFARALSVIKTFESDSGATAQSKLIKGRIAFSQQQYANAEAIFADLFQRQPNNLEHMYLYSLTLLENPDKQKQQLGAQLARRNFQLNPTNQLTSSILGWAVYQTGNKKDGRQLLLRAAQTGSMLPDTAFLVARMLIEEGEEAQAKITLNQYVKNPAIFVYRARAKEILESLGSVDAELPGPSKN